MCQKRFEKFSAGDSSHNNVPSSTRPDEIDSEKNKKLLDNKQHVSTQRGTKRVENIRTEH